MANRFAVTFQAFITNGAVITCTEAGRIATAGNTTLNLSTTGGAGTFTITLGSGCTGTLTSGTATITGSVLALAAGANTVTSNGAGNCTLNLTLGTAANWNTVNSWSASSGGVSGASVPTSADNTFMDANSFTAASQVLTVDATANCLDMDWTGATNTPTLTGSSNLNVYGNVTFILAMVFSVTGELAWQSNGALTTNGLTLTGLGSITPGNGNLTLNDDLNAPSKTIYHWSNTLNTNGKTVIAAQYLTNNISIKTLILGTSILNLTSGFNHTGSNLTLTANTATIKVTGTGAFAGGGITTYYNVELNGTSHTISGSNTFNDLSFKPSGAQAITWTDGTTQTVTTMSRTGTGTITFAGSAAAGWAISKASGRVALWNMSISRSTVSGGAAFYAGSTSTNGGNNSGWMFRNPVGVWK